ncbi:MAG: MBL fold metallo-hydrolase [Candidatus Hodarchaeota archaeon]
MIIGMIGARGTVPSSEIATVSFLIDNRYLFECPSEIVQSFHKFQKEWDRIPDSSANSEILTIGRPTFSKIKYIILSHLHYDHWGGLSHIIHRILLLEKEMRQKKRLKLIIPKNSTLPFQQRTRQLFEDFTSNFPLTDDEFLYRLLTIKVGHSVKEVLQIIVIEDGEKILLDNGYSLSGKENKHLTSGSFSYKLERKKVKLNVKKAKEMGIPFNRTLKRIEKSQNIINLGKQRVTRKDIFFDLKTIICYSGDTQIDLELFEFFDDCQILIHEATYLKPQESYHLDAHSDVESLIREAETLSNIKALIPIHFSTRYKDEEITNFLNSLPISSYQLINPFDVSIIQIKSDNSLIIIRRM